MGGRLAWLWCETPGDGGRCTGQGGDRRVTHHHSPGGESTGGRMEGLGTASHQVRISAHGEGDGEPVAPKGEV